MEDKKELRSHLISKKEIIKTFAKERCITFIQAEKEWKQVEETIQKLLLNKKSSFCIGNLKIVRKETNPSRLANLKIKTKPNTEVYFKPFKYVIEINKSVVKDLMNAIKKITEKE